MGASLSWAPAVLGPFCAEVVSARLNLSHGTIDVRRVYAPRFLSRPNKDLEWRTLKPPQHVTALGSWTDCIIALRQISVTALFYLDHSRKIHLWGVRAGRSKDVKRRAPQCAGEREPFVSSFYMFFSSPWACLMQIGPGQECCSTWSPHSSPQTFLCSIFAGFSLPCLLATDILDSCFLL